MKAKSLLFVSFLIVIFVFTSSCKKDDIQPSKNNKKLIEANSNASYYTGGGTNTVYTGGNGNNTFTNGGGGNSFVGGSTSSGGGNNGGGETNYDCILGEWVIPSDECENYPHAVGINFSSNGEGVGYIINTDACIIMDEQHFEWYIENGQLVMTYENEHVSITDFSCPAEQLNVQWYIEGFPYNMTLVRP